MNNKLWTSYECKENMRVQVQVKEKEIIVRLVENNCFKESFKKGGLVSILLFNFFCLLCCEKNSGDLHLL